jgi:type VI secretion system protein ImpE
MTSEELFQAGRLTEALEAQTQVVKAQPAAIVERFFLFELLCFQDEFDRADKQLEAIVRLDPNQDPVVQPYRNLITAERRRLQLFTEGLPPAAHGEAPPRFTVLLQAIHLLRQSKLAEAAEVVSLLEPELPLLSVRGENIRGEDFRDGDDLFASVLELFVGPDYVWVPLENIQSLQVGKPSRPRDLLWAQANLMLTDGTLLRGLIPVRYIESGSAGEDALRLGHRTEWTDPAGGPVRGIGQRTFFAGDEAYGLLDLDQIQLNPAVSE